MLCGDKHVFVAKKSQLVVTKQMTLVAAPGNDIEGTFYFPERTMFTTFYQCCWMTTTSLAVSSTVSVAHSHKTENSEGSSDIL